MVKPNEGGSNKVFNLTADTRVRTGPHRLGSGTQSDQQGLPTAGDRVLVITLDGSSDARAVFVTNPSSSQGG